LAAWTGLSNGEASTDQPNSSGFAAQFIVAAQMANIPFRVEDSAEDLSRKVS
jgi:hypothetical protein